MSSPIKRRLMTPDELQIVERMHCVTYPSASWDKRFMRMISGGEMISEKESEQLWRLFVRYRRQMIFPDKARLLKEAERKAAPDFRKVQADIRKAALATQKLEEYRKRANQCFHGTPDDSFCPKCQPTFQEESNQ